MGLWRGFAAAARYEFQPIVNVHSGVCYGVEALLRGVEEAGFPDLAAVFERAEAEGAAADLESLLIAKAIDRFVSLAPPPTTHLFCNMSASGLRADGDLAGGLSALCAARGLAASLLCLEISETAAPLARGIVRRRSLELQRAGLAVAIDDFGRGEAGLQLIYDVAPRFLKIDELFIRKLTSDPKSKGFVAGVIRLVHQIGVTVIAEGVETEAEFLACLEIGCDLAQGRFVQSPTLDPLKLTDRYGAIEATAEQRRHFFAGLYDHTVDEAVGSFHDAESRSRVIWRASIATFFVNDRQRGGAEAAQGSAAQHGGRRDRQHRGGEEDRKTCPRSSRDS